METVMTAETGNVVGHDHTIADLEFPHIPSDLDDLAGNLVTQDHRALQLLKTELVNIRKTNPARFNLKQ